MKDTSFLKKLIGFSLSSYINLFITLISVTCLTRIFDPDVIGKINFFLTCQNVIVSICLLGLDQAFCRYYYEVKSDNKTDNLFSVCIKCSILLNILISFICLLFWKNISIYIGGEASLIIVVCLGISSGLHIVCRYFNIYQRMEQGILTYTLLAVLITIAHKLSYIGITNKNYINSIVIMTVSFILITVFFYIIKFYKVIKFKNKSIDISLKRKIISFGLPLMPVSMLSWLNNSLPQFFMKEYLDYAAIGIYSNAVIIASIINVLQSGFNILWTPYVYENYREESDKIKKIHDFVSLGMVAFGLMTLFVQDFIYIFIGSEYKISQEFFAFLIISPICYTIAETAGIGINLSKKSYLHIYTYIGCIITNVVFCFILIPYAGLVGVGVSVSIASLVSLIIKTVIGEKYYRCINNKMKTFSAIGIMFCGATLNYILFSYPIKYLIFIMLLVILLLMYNKETIYILKLIRNIVSHKNTKK